MRGVEVYGDLYMLLNALCDALALTLTAAVLKIRVRKRRIAAGALFGGGFALLTLYLPRALALGLSVPAAAFMVLIAFSFGGLRRYLLRLFVFFCGCFLLGGMAQFLGELVGRVLPPPFPSLFLLLVLFLAVFTAMLFAEILKRKAAICKATLRFTYNAQTYETEGLCDSGNLLRDEEGRAVILVCRDLLRDYRTERHICVRTALTSGELPLIEPSELFINGKKADALLAISHQPGFGGCAALLPAALLTIH